MNRPAEPRGSERIANTSHCPSPARLGKSRLIQAHSARAMHFSLGCGHKKHERKGLQGRAAWIQGGDRRRIYRGDQRRSRLSGQRVIDRFALTSTWWASPAMQRRLAEWLGVFGATIAIATYNDAPKFTSLAAMGAWTKGAAHADG